MKKIMVTGTFDFLHPGHLAYFEQARKLGDYLIVVVARDSTAKEEKGSPPLVSEADRLRLVQELRIVDKAILGSEGDRLKVIEELKPDILCLGYDQNIDQAELEKELRRRNLNTQVTRLQPYKPEYYKSGILKKNDGGDYHGKETKIRLGRAV